MKKAILLLLIISLCFACCACGGNIHNEPDALAEKAVDALFGYGDSKMLMELVLPAVKNYSEVGDMYTENYSRMIRELQSDGFQLQSYKITEKKTLSSQDTDYADCVDILNQVGCDGDYEIRLYEITITATYDDAAESNFIEAVYLVKMDHKWYVLMIPFF